LHCSKSKPTRILCRGRAIKDLKRSTLVLVLFIPVRPYNARACAAIIPILPGYVVWALGSKAQGEIIDASSEDQ
jgi:hypothetical protein